MNDRSRAGPSNVLTFEVNGNRLSETLLQSPYIHAVSLCHQRRLLQRAKMQMIQFLFYDFFFAYHDINDALIVSFSLLGWSIRVDRGQTTWAEMSRILQS